MAEPSNDTETLSGRVERVVYHDARSRYTVLRLQVPGHATLVTAVGRTNGIEPEADVTVRGRWDEHPTHGRQFAFSQVQVHVEVPTTVAGIERRLRRYPGIKDVMAARIVARFGQDTFAILDGQPRRLLEVEGIGPSTLEKIVEHHRKHAGPEFELEAQLLELDVPAYLARSIFQKYGGESLAVLRGHPYLLAREVRGIGFATADRIARAQGLAEDSEERIDAGLLHVLEQAELDGHTALPIEELVARATSALGVDEEAVRSSGERMVELGDLELAYGSDDTPLCFPRRWIAAERDVAAMLVQMAGVPRERWTVDDLPASLSAGQREAVHAVADHGVVVLTGGPGTGKSTVVKEILAAARKSGVEVKLAAPTGRAAKRLEQATGMAASTIHRLLEIDPESGRFTRGPGNPLPVGLLVVDESSMLDAQIAQALFGALEPEHRLLLVGDADQLPSVGPGNVLADVMQAAARPEAGIRLVRLTEVFRQAEGSSIIANAHRILAGESLEPDPPGEGGAFFVIAARGPEHAHDLIVRTAVQRIPAAYGFDARTAVQVLCPMHKGPGGTEAINRALQDQHTAGQPELRLRSSTGSRVFRVGDRVMQVRNDYTKGVFNGDVGVVMKVEPAEEALAVDFDGSRVHYIGNECAALQLAYAISIHKSQGSEFDAVVLSLLSQHYVMLQRNLIYTAVTRARKLCVIVGEPSAIRRAIQRADAGRRHTGLTRRILDAVEENEAHGQSLAGAET